MNRLKLAIAVILGRRAVVAGRSLVTFPDDAFLVSYPRSGNTWVRFLVGNLMNPDEPVTFANIEARIPDIYQNDDNTLQHTPRPRILKSHEYFDPRYRRVVNIVRDPRDVAVSYYHYQIKTRRFGDDYPMSEFVPRFVSGEIDRFGSWGEHVGSWLGAREGTDGLLVVCYEKMLQDPIRELARVAAYLGIDTSEERLTLAVELSSAGTMRQLEAKQAHLWRPTRQSRRDKPFVRSARAGGWHNQLPSDCARNIERAWEYQMKALGYL